ncbi:class III signal peptide-containing protein [Methanococcus sp. CF]
MKFLEKLTSKKGQVSMEIGILVAAAVAVAAIAAYFYATNVKNAQADTGAAAASTTGNLTGIATSATDAIGDITFT